MSAQLGQEARPKPTPALRRDTASKPQRIAGSTVAGVLVASDRRTSVRRAEEVSSTCANVGVARPGLTRVERVARPSASPRSF